MSFVALRQGENISARDMMRRVGRTDWLRLADAEEAGEKAPYNLAFSEDFERSAYYDRFFPDDAQENYMATRHIFGGAHYNLTTVTDPDPHPKYGDFARDHLQIHFRRHYAQLGLIVRFEYPSLLAFSSRITRAVRDLQAEDGKLATFEQEVAAIHKDGVLARPLLGRDRG